MVTDMTNSRNFELNCPLPISEYDRVLLAHGGGGTLSRKLIQEMFFSQFGNDYLLTEHDSAMLPAGKGRVAFSTDSYVVQPIFFPGGNIGELAVNGTVNDLAMAGAIPKFISVGFIIEEGLLMEELWRIILSMRDAAQRAGVQIVTGDTKVVDKGKGDKIFINTSGIGWIPEGVNIAPQNCREGDVILVNGYIAEHGVTIMSAREGLEFETTLESDTAALNGLVAEILAASNHVHVLRDPTRGGLASALNEIASAASLGIEIKEEAVPIAEQVKGACEILGLDPLYIANEGKVLAFVPAADGPAVLKAMRSHPLGTNSAIIGRVTREHPGTVIMQTSIGSGRIVDMISGEQLPRIC